MAAPIEIEIEAGEILDSDDEFSQQPLQKASNTSLPYRDTALTRRDSSEDSSDDDSNDDESDEDIPSKKRRPGRSLPQNKGPFNRGSVGFGQSSTSIGLDSGAASEREVFTAAAGEAPKQGQERHSKPGKKNYNIWSSVVQNQNQEAVERKMTAGFDIEAGLVGRDVETYSIGQPRHMPLAVQAPAPLATPNLFGGGAAPRETISYDCEGIEIDNRVSVKERLGERVVNPRKRRWAKKEEDGVHYMRDTRVTVSDSPEDVAEEIAHVLGEEKVDLIHRVVETIGTNSALMLLSQTKTVELNGGLMIRNGTRRRTPGGVYLYLLKSFPGISEEQVKHIFANDDFCENKKHKKKKSKKKSNTVKMETTTL